MPNAMRVAVEAELERDILRQTLIQLRIARRKMSVNGTQFVKFFKTFQFSSMIYENFVEFLNQLLHGRNELNEALRHEDRAEIPT